MPKTLLLADDSVTMQKVVGITFANEDVRLVTVDNGDDALERAREVKPSVVLADVGMPGLNGYELCAAIKSEPELKHIKVILLTGTFDTYDENRAREVGADAHVSKPFEAQALVDQVRSLIARSESEGSAKLGSASLDDPHFDFDAPSASAKPAAAAAPAKAAAAPAKAVAAPAKAVAPAPPAAPKPAAAAPKPAAAPIAAPKPAPAPVAAREPARPTLESVAPKSAGAAAAAAGGGPDDAIDDLYDDAGFGDSSEQESPILGRTPTPTGSGIGQAYDLSDEEPATDSGIFGEPFSDPGTSLAEDTAPDLLVERDEQGVPLVEYDETVIASLADDVDDVLDVSDELLEIPDDVEPPLTLTGPTQPKPAPPKPAAPAPAAAKPAAPAPAAAKPAASAKPAPRAESHAAGDLTTALDEPLWAEPLDDGESLDEAPAPETPKPSAPPRRESPAPRESASADRSGALPPIDPQRIHDAIEKVAWEAFGPLAEQVVREVSRKVEAIAWETIPMLAERIIREEIARLKAQDED